MKTKISKIILWSLAFGLVFSLNVALAKNQPNGTPFKAIWEAIEDLQTQIGGLQCQSCWDEARIAELEARVAALECTPEAEVCDGEDNDCDDEVDEGALCQVSDPNASGICDQACIYTCDLGYHSCGTSGSEIQCYADNDVLHCGDNLFCTACGPEQVCVNNEICVTVDCDDGNPCTTDSYNTQTQSCVNTPDVGNACDDGNDCTSNDICDPTGLCIGVSHPDEFTSCDGPDADSCPMGIWVCIPGGALECIDDVPDFPEICDNGTDDDCDGAVDEGCVG
jgi:hypothetical protein